LHPWAVGCATLTAIEQGRSTLEDASLVAFSLAATGFPSLPTGELMEFHRERLNLPFDSELGLSECSLCLS
jgi:hypothetical protein